MTLTIFLRVELFLNSSNKLKTTTTCAWSFIRLEKARISTESASKLDWEPLKYRRLFTLTASIYAPCANVSNFIHLCFECFNFWSINQWWLTNKSLQDTQLNWKRSTLREWMRLKRWFIRKKSIRSILIDKLAWNFHQSLNNCCRSPFCNHRSWTSATLWRLSVR